MIKRLKSNKRKKTITLLVLLFATIVCANAQTYRLYQTKNYHNQLRLNTVTGSVEQIQDDGQRWTIVYDIEPNGEYTNRFQLFETKNMWTFIELDTFNGRLWQVQYSVEGTKYMFSVPINEIPLDYSRGRSVFTIQPMTSMYQYYLINGDTGEMWQFQWTTDGPEYRWIKKL